MAELKHILMTDGDAELLEQFVKALRNIRGGGGIEITLAPGQGLSVVYRGRTVGGRQIRSAQVADFRVQTVHENYLACKRWDSVNSQVTGDAINIAKYPEVQQQEYDGLTLTDPLDATVEWTFAYTGAQARTVTRTISSSSAGEEDQVITPRYIPADSPSWSGSRLVAAKLSTVVLDDDGATDVTCAWIELTNRAYARKATP